MLRSCFLSSFVEFYSAVSEEKLKTSQKTIKLGRRRLDLEARAAILFFPDWPEKHKRGRRHWELAFCQVSLNSVQRFHQRSRKCLSFLSSFVEFRSAVSSEKSKMSQPIRGQGCHFVFPISPKNTNLVKGVEILHPIKFRRIPFRGEVENVSAN